MFRQDNEGVPVQAQLVERLQMYGLPACGTRGRYDVTFNSLCTRKFTSPLTSGQHLRGHNKTCRQQTHTEKGINPYGLGRSIDRVPN